ncbi:MAG TPA: hypothetical protein VGE64_05925 [Xanthomonadaceae bacterium]
MSALRMLPLLCLTASLAACYSVPPEVRNTPVQPQPEARPIGGDRDAHGCLPAAGYSWCARENSCVRPWELAKAKGFANDADAFAAYCAVPAKP